MFKKRTLTALLSIFPLIYLEIIIRLFTVGSFDKRFVFAILFAIPVGGILFLTTLFTDKLYIKIIYNVLIAACAVYFCVQLVYYNIFQGFLSLSLVGMGGDAMTNFKSEMFNAIKATALPLILVFLLIPAYAVLTKLKLICFEKANFKTPIITAAAIVLAHCLCLCSLLLGGTEQFSVYDSYHSMNTTIDGSVQNLGIFVTGRLELKNMILIKLGLLDPTSPDEGFEELVTPEDGNTENTAPEDEVTSENYNILDIDFKKLRSLVKEGSGPDSVLKSIKWRGGTKKNEYTGMFEGYNLITICAESFSSRVIDKEITPTLYKLSTEGFIFENFYGSYESVTTDGEFTFCLGMFPDLSRGKYNSSFKLTNNNALPYAPGNIFKSIGAKTYAYHNNNGTYYGRNVSHPHMGYDVFKTPDNGLDIKLTWPASDLDMMKASVDDYISSGEQFHTYYMTFSGHHQYNWKNLMSRKNRDKVEHLDYSEPVKAYIAANLELEYALTYLLERLEEEGIAEKTVIVLTTDHYPYGLSPEQFNELAGEEVEGNFEKYRNSFICWNGGMKEPVKVDKLCSTIDILPTLLNLFGFEFDSRFIIGRDVLSDHEGVAILANKSFITEDFRFNAIDNEVTVNPDSDITEEEIEKKKSYISGTIGLSRSILNTDIFQYLEQYIEADGNIEVETEDISSDTTSE